MYFPMACVSRPESSEMQVIRHLHPSSQGVGLAEELLNHADGEDIIFIQYCVCGTSLSDAINWYPGDDPAAGKVNDAGLYAKFLKYAADARRQVEAAGHEWKVKGVFWHQGEADSNAQAENYEANFRRLIARLRIDWGADLPVVAGKIRSLTDEARKVNEALNAVAGDEPKLAVVEVDDLPAETPTNVHFNTAGCQELGRRLARAFFELSGDSESKP